MKPTYSSEDVTQLNYCTYCPRLCHFSCPASLGDGSETATGWGMMTLANIVRKGEVGVTEDVAKTFYNCASCRRCQDFCKHENDVAAVMGIARAQVVQLGATPEALRGWVPAFEQFGCASEPSATVSALLPDAPPLARVGLFLSCSHRTSLDPAWLDRLLTLLTDLAGEPVVLAWSKGSVCCGAVARRAGMVELADSVGARLADELGKYEILLTDCTDLQDQLAGSVAPLAASRPKIVHVTQFLASHTHSLADRVAEGTALRATSANKAPEQWVLHGGCRERRYSDLEEAEFAVLRGLGAQVEEAFAYKGQQECCGGEAVYAAVNPQAAAAAGADLAERLRQDSGHDALRVTSSCACAAHFRSAAAGGQNASEGGTSITSVLELVVERCTTPT